jgi:threonine/homoserine/homoserine lactone efflux protein
VPGPAVALLIRRCSVGGFRAGVPVVLGLEAGLYAWILAAGAGLATLVATSHTAYTVLRVVGTAVLIVLGVQALRAARRETYDADLLVTELVPAARLLPRGRAGAFGMAAVTNLANPKAALITFAFYPQFIPHGYPVLPTATALGPAAGHRGDRLLPGPSRSHRPGPGVVRPTAGPAHPGRAARHRPDRLRPTRSHRVRLTRPAPPTARRR